jgi:hypothetical protein
MRSKRWRKWVWIPIPAVILASLIANRVLLPEANPGKRLAAPILSESSDALLKRACFDCHSNETHWPWYAYVPPVSTLVVFDVAQGRRHLNFSRWDELPAGKQGKLARKMVEEVTDDSMPLPRYLRLHRDAVVKDADLEKLKNDVLAKYGEGPVHVHGQDDDDDEEDK